MEIETLTTIAQAFGFIVLYAITGFGPGFAIGILVGNLTLGREAPSLRVKQEEAIVEAGEHNAQWSPAHKRWKDKT